jgi:heat shock protein HtpX
MLANFAFLFRGGHGDNRSPLGAIGMIAVMILAPLTAMMVQFAISRSREYGADAGGAALTGDPLALASALSKLEQGARRIPNNDAEANPATAHLFIVNPLSGRGADNLFSTHPSTANRVKRLQEMAGGNAGGAWNPAAQVAAPRPASHRPGLWG